jgi:hypothetical protein
MPGYVFAYFRTGDNVAAAQVTTLLVEGRTWPIDNQWSVRVDRSHAPGMDDHLHIQFKGKDAAIINKNGTPSHGTDPNNVPNWVHARIKDMGLKEGYLVTEASLLIEGVPAGVVAAAVDHEELIDRASKL